MGDDLAACQGSLEAVVVGARSKASAGVQAVEAGSHHLPGQATHPSSNKIGGGETTSGEGFGQRAGNVAVVVVPSGDGVVVM